MRTSGADAIAVFAESVGASGLGGGIDVLLGNAATGTAQIVSGGTGAGHGVALGGGAANLLTSYATLTTQGGINGMTVTGALGGDSVVSYGHLIGSVDLGAGANALDNKPYRSAANPTDFSGVFDSGATVSVGAGNPFTNEGALSAGALLNVFTTNVTGNFIQTATGSCGGFGAPTSACGYLATDLDFNNQTSDRINVAGTAKVSGAMVINILNPGLALPGAHDVTLVGTTAGATMPGLIRQSQPTAVATYTLMQPNPDDIDLHYVIDFSPKGLTQNQHAVGGAINAIQTARISPAFTPIAAALFYQPDIATLGKVYDSLSGEGVAASQQAAYAATDRFQTSVMKQMQFWSNGLEQLDGAATVYGGGPLAYAPQPGHPAFGGLDPAPAGRSWRVWGSGFGGGSTNPGDGAVGSARSKEGGAGFALGLDYQIDPGALVGGAGGYGRSTYSVGDRATSGAVENGHVSVYGALRSEKIYLFATFGRDFFGSSEQRAASIPGTVLPPVRNHHSGHCGLQRNPDGHVRQLRLERADRGRLSHPPALARPDALCRRAVQPDACRRLHRNQRGRPEQDRPELCRAGRRVGAGVPRRADLEDAEPGRPARGGLAAHRLASRTRPAAPGDGGVHLGAGLLLHGPRRRGHRRHRAHRRRRDRASGQQCRGVRRVPGRFRSGRRPQPHGIRRPAARVVRPGLAA